MKNKYSKLLLTATSCLAPLVCLTSCGAAYQIYVDKPKGCSIKVEKSYVKELDGIKWFCVDFKGSNIDTGLEDIKYSSRPSDASQWFPLGEKYWDFENHGTTCTAQVNMTYLKHDKADVVALRYTFI